MRFPPTPGPDAGADALDRLAAARDERVSLADQHADAEPGAGEAHAAAALGAADERVAAREAWAAWALEDDR